MARQFHLRPVIEARSAQRAIVHAKAGNANDMKRHVGSSTQASDVPCVGWDLGLDKRNADHQQEYTLWSVTAGAALDSIKRERQQSGARPPHSKNKKRRASLEGLVVSFARPCRPQMFVCAGGRFVL